MKKMHEVFYTKDITDGTDVLLFKQFVKNFAQRHPNYTYEFKKDVTGVGAGLFDEDGNQIENVLDLWSQYCNLKPTDYKLLADQAGYILDDNLELVV